MKKANQCAHTDADGRCRTLSLALFCRAHRDQRIEREAGRRGKSVFVTGYLRLDSRRIVDS